MRLRALVAVLGLTAATVTTAVGAPPSTAVASTACSSSVITINAGPGAEPPTTASGHRHNTGNHYVGAISGGFWYWYADNNGGMDGDTTDSFYGSRRCS